jgi:adenylate kinase
MQKRVVMLGPPGAGKGTQSVMLAVALGVPHFSTGQILRDGAAARDPDALAVKSAIDAGGFAPDEMMNPLVERRITSPEAADGFVLDGYPRTFAQAVAFDTALGKLGMEIRAVLLAVDENALVARIAGRAAKDAADGRAVRTDDDPAVFAKRLKTYQTITASVVEYYSVTGVLSSVDGMADPEAVQSTILASLA